MRQRKPNFSTSTMAFPAPAEPDHMGEARSLRYDCSIAAGTASFWQRTDSGKSHAVLHAGLGETAKGILATSCAGRRVWETRWRRIDHLCRRTRGGRIRARARAGWGHHPNCAVPTLDASAPEMHVGLNWGCSGSKHQTFGINVGNDTKFVVCFQS